MVLSLFAGISLVIGMPRKDGSRSALQRVSSLLPKRLYETE
ncbi:hypothetical protein [Methylomonas fluvii]|nr:hypothetical protein [Methylomonas fluvii]